MDYAFLIENDVNVRLVYIADLQELEQELVRSFCYRCLDNNCAVAMRPVFPRKRRKRGKEAHSPHFRAQPKNHINGCQASKRKEVISDTTADKGKNKIFDVVERADYPIRFTKTVRKKKPSEAVETFEPESADGKGDASITKAPTRRESKPQSNNIRRFIEAFEKFPNDRHQMEIILPGCPARNYSGAFFYLGEAEKQRLDRLASYIFWGEYISHSVHPSGTSVLFGTVSVNNLKVGVWIPGDLNSDPLWEIIFARLEKAASQRNATVYIFGRFVNHQNWKYSIELKDLYDFWISFPEDIQS